MRAFCLALLLLFSFGIFSSSGFAQQSTAPSAPAGNQKTNAKTNGPSITVSPKATEILIDASIPDDPDILKMLEPYRARVRELEVVIGRLEGDLRKGRIGAGSLGNFVTDGLRAEASRKLGNPVVLMVTNGGGMRKNSIAEGELRVRDIFELAPFENSLISVDLTGSSC